MLNNSCVKWIYYTCISLYVYKIEFIILASFLHLRTSLMEKKIKSKKVHFSYFLCSLDTSFTRPWIELHHWHTGCVSSNAQYLYYIRIFEGRIRYWTELYTSLVFFVLRIVSVSTDAISGCWVVVTDGILRSSGSLRRK